MSTRDRSQHGFTFVDILAAMAIIAILSLVTVPAAMGTIRTFRRNVAARHLLIEIRRTQSLAVTRAAPIALQWGAALSGRYSAGKYRIARDTTGSCDFPALSDPADGTDVIRGWIDLDDSYPGIKITSVRDAADRPMSGVTFDALGASVNSCDPVSFPVKLTLSDPSGRSETIVIGRSGVARML